ncbi:MAG TPA: basic secretory protein-like protein [Tepidisphaeraceae bacterium]|jgi:hypothetical protein|nr:basic secretory protein-like protein [Tepidisphaeraceae bacterium]
MTRGIFLFALLMFAGSSFAQRDDRTLPATRPTTRPATTQAATQPVYEISIECEVPELQEWADSLRPIVEKWYPRIVQTLPSEGYAAPRKFTIHVRNARGVAYTAGTHIVCAAEYFKNHQDDRGAVVHELVHVAQQYRSRSNPGWLVEGLADYIRWFKYEPANKRPRPRPDRAKYTDSYRVTGAFLEWLAANKDHEIVVKFNAAMRQGHYKPELWQEYTGQTVDELWAEYIESLRAK